MKTYPLCKFNNDAAPIKLTAIQAVPCIIRVPGITKFLSTTKEPPPKQTKQINPYLNDILMSTPGAWAIKYFFFRLNKILSINKHQKYLYTISKNGTAERVDIHTMKAKSCFSSTSRTLRKRFPETVRPSTLKFRRV